MIKIILILFAIVYIFTVLNSIFELFQIIVCLKKLNKFISAYNQSLHYYPFGNRRYSKQLNSLLRYYPVICKYVSSPELSYHRQDSVNRENSEYLRDEFLMEKNYKSRDLLRSFFGITAISYIFNFPFYLLSRFGFRPRRTNKTTVNTIGIIIEVVATYLLGRYFDKIVLIIENLINQQG